MKQECCKNFYFEAESQESWTPNCRSVLDRDRFFDRDREREQEWLKVPGTGINRERE